MSGVISTVARPTRSSAERAMPGAPRNKRSAQRSNILLILTLKWRRRPERPILNIHTMAKKRIATPELSPEQRDELLKSLQSRFEEHMNRHRGLVWAKVQAKLAANPDKLRSLHEMEKSGGEPDVVGFDKKM